MHYTGRMRRKIMAMAFGIIIFINPQKPLFGWKYNAEMFFHISGLHFIKEYILTFHC